MEIEIAGRHTDVPEPLRAVVEEKIGRVGRFLDGMDKAEVIFLEERNPRIADKEVCEVTLHGHGLIVRARAAAGDGYAAVDKVVDKLEHRLDKLKGKLVARSHPRRAGHVVDQPLALNGSGPVDAHREDEDEPDAGARIVRTKRFDIKPMTPEEAALQLELLGHAFFLFTNADTGSAAVVYRRDDGDVGLIEGA